MMSVAPGRRAATCHGGWAALISLLLAACGGASGLDTPPSVSNPIVTGGQTLSFAYYQRCIQPIFITPLSTQLNGATAINTCASAGCHDTVVGTGGAFRLIASAAPLDLATVASAPEAARGSDMYKNFFSAKASSILGAPQQSRLLTKPLVQNVLHGGGLIFASADDPNAQRIAYWISRPMPLGQDEFSAAANGMFTPADAATGACNTQ